MFRLLISSVCVSGLFFIFCASPVSFLQHFWYLLPVVISFIVFWVFLVYSPLVTLPISSQLWKYFSFWYAFLSLFHRQFHRNIIPDTCFSFRFITYCTVNIIHKNKHKTNIRHVNSDSKHKGTTLLGLYHKCTRLYINYNTPAFVNLSPTHK